MQIANRHEKILNPTNHQGNANQNHEISPHTCQNVCHHKEPRACYTVWSKSRKKSYINISFINACISNLEKWFSSVAQLCPTLCNTMNRSTPGLPVHHHLPEFTQTHVHQVGDAIQPSHPLSSPSPPAPNSFQHQSLFQWVNSLHEVAKVLEFQL